MIEGARLECWGREVGRHGVHFITHLAIFPMPVNSVALDQLHFKQGVFSDSALVAEWGVPAELLKYQPVAHPATPDTFTGWLKQMSIVHRAERETECRCTFIFGVYSTHFYTVHA